MQWLSAPFPIPHAAPRWKPSRGKDLHHQVIAFGHAAAVTGNTKLMPPKGDAKLWSQLPFPKQSYRALFDALKRSYYALSAIKGSSPAIRAVKVELWNACFGETLEATLALQKVIRDHDVLILGETGTGKDLAANAISVSAITSTKPAHGTINAAALPELLVESELFGHRKGAFTGALDNRKGRLIKADGGTFFLDEIGDLPLSTQVKLLRTIENDEFFPLGADTPQKCEIRFVSATHKSMEALVESGKFRRDLFERIAGQIIWLPPLRERPGDIMAIGRALLAEWSLPEPLVEKGESWLKSHRDYRWPGNVRELQNRLRSALLGLPAPSSPAIGHQVPTGIAQGRMPLQEVEKWYFQHVMEKMNNNITKAAIVLGIDRSTLRRRLKS